MDLGPYSAIENKGIWGYDPHTKGCMAKLYNVAVAQVLESHWREPVEFL